MRIKKDPQIRKDVFIDAAQSLFFAKGFKSTSIRDILDLVGDDASSPSVFYYYFASKEAIYQEVMNRYADIYLRDITQAAQSGEDKTVLLRKVIKTYARFLTGSGHFAEDNKTLSNMLIYLDIRERVTQRLIPVWIEMIKEWLPEIEDPAAAASFICGGISQMTQSFQLLGPDDKLRTDELVRQIFHYACAVLQIDKSTEENFWNGIMDDGKNE